MTPDRADYFKTHRGYAIGAGKNVTRDMFGEARGAVS